VLRPDDTPQAEEIATAWLQLIEQELLRSWTPGFWAPPEYPSRSPPVLTIYDHVIQDEVIDLLDDMLKERGWKLHRPIRDYSGEPLSPNQRTIGNGYTPVTHYFGVMADRPCLHYFGRAYGNSVGFCRHCGQRPEPCDYVNEA
jgi:hypothetical protein